MENKEREQVEIKPTWRLAWGLFWRMFLMALGAYGILFLIMLAIGITLSP